MPKDVYIKPEAGVTYTFRGGVKLASAKLGQTKTTAVVQASGTYVEPLPPVEPDAAPIVTAGPTLSGLTSTSVSIGWSLSEKATGQVEYGPNYSLSTPPEASLIYATHAQNLTGLTPDTTYLFRVVGKDSAGQSYMKGSSFRTLPVATPPPPPVGLVYPPDTTLRAVPVNNDPMPGG